MYIPKPINLPFLPVNAKALLSATTNEIIFDNVNNISQNNVLIRSKIIRLPIVLSITMDITATTKYPIAK